PRHRHPARRLRREALPAHRLARAPGRQCASPDRCGARGRRPIVFIQHCENVPGEPFEEGTEHWELHEALVPARGDTVLRKYASSSFEGTDLDGRLKDKGIEALTLCGLQ